MTVEERREFIGALALSGAALGASRRRAPHPPSSTSSDVKKETDVACLYHCDFGDRSASRRC